MNHEALEKQLREWVLNRAWDQICCFLEERGQLLFSDQHISKYYHIIKNADLDVSSHVLPKLMMGWLAFLSGDQPAVVRLVRQLDQTPMDHLVHEYSFFLSLKALAAPLVGESDPLMIAETALKMLPESDSTFFMANAELTYAQVLAGNNQFRHAAELFSSSFHLFSVLELEFPAVVALVNAQLNRYRLGDLAQVMDVAQKYLSQSGHFRDDNKSYWDLLYLPMGMSCYDLGKFHLAKEYLATAKKAIDAMNLFHMHGLIELYLFKACYCTDDQKGMEEVVGRAKSDFGPMHNPMMDILIDLFSFYKDIDKDRASLTAIIERLDIHHQMYCAQPNPYVLEMMVQSELRSIEVNLQIEKVIDLILHYRYIGKVADLQLFLVLVAEWYALHRRERESREYMKEAVELFRDYQICSAFFSVPISMLPLIQRLDRKLFRMIPSRMADFKPIRASFLLTEKEREVLTRMDQGLSNQEIAKALVVSPGTIKWHINHIYGKLEAENRVDAIRKARELGEIS